MVRIWFKKYLGVSGGTSDHSGGDIIRIGIWGDVDIQASWASLG